MKRVVNLLHRQAVRSKAEGLLFKVSTLNVFRSIMAKQSTLPKEQPYKDLVTFINFILRKFFKAVSEEPLLLVEVSFSAFCAAYNLNILIVVVGVLPQKP